MGRHRIGAPLDLDSVYGQPARRWVRREAARTGATIWFVDEAPLCADAELRGIWVLNGG